MSTQPESGGIEFTCTETGPNRHVIVHRGTMAAPAGKVWALVRDFQRFVGVLLPTVAFEWLDGGSPGKVPSRYQLTVGSTRLVEELDHCDEREHTLRYHLLTPGLGMLAYAAEIKLTPAGAHQTVVEYMREITMEQGVSINGLTPLFHQQLAGMTAHFAKGS